MTMGETLTHATTTRSRKWTPVAIAATLLGSIQFLIGAIWAGIPSYWGDETATLTATNRSLPDLAKLVSHIDGVHAVYYVIQGTYMSVVGTDPFAARLTSVLAVALTVAGIVVLGKRLVNLRAGIFAGILGPFLPGLAWTSTELRSFALTALLAVATALLLESATRSKAARLWVLYAATLALSVWVFVFSALLIFPLAVLAWTRKSLRPWLWATSAAVVASLPIVALTMTQTGQVAWIKLSPPQLAAKVAISQYFFGQRPPGAAEGPLTIIAAALTVSVVAVLGWFAYRSIKHRTNRELLVLAVWVIVPTAMLVAVTLLGKPLYQERYLTFTIPALLILIGAALAAMPKRAGIASATALCLIALPILASQKTEGAKADNYAALSRFVDGSKDGGALAVYAAVKARGIALAYPDSFEGVRDAAAGPPAAEDETFWGGTTPAADLPADQWSGQRVLLFSTTATGTADAYYQRLIEDRCKPIDEAVDFSLTTYLFAC